jgi:hypothetical protein
VAVLTFYSPVGGPNANGKRWAAPEYPAMTTRDALAKQRAFERRTGAYAKAGLTTDALVWAVAADMCRAAAWTARYGAFEAELLVSQHCPGD